MSRQNGSMKVRMVFQPFNDCSSLYEVLAQALDDERLTELSIVVAWAKESGLKHIRTNLQEFRERGGKARILLGIDEGGATLEGLHNAIDDFKDGAWVLNNKKSGTFHPKLYIISGKTASVVIVGSSNLTQGGFFGNYEAGVCLELDLNDDADVKIHKAVTHYIERLRDDRTTLPLTKKLIQQLQQSLRFRIDPEDFRKSTEAGGDSSGTSEEEDAPQLFGPSRHKMKRAPARSRNVQATVNDINGPSNREQIKLLGESKRGQSFPLSLPSGGAGQVPCEAVPELIFFCWDTAEGPRRNASFNGEARRLQVQAVVEWSANYQYIGLNPENRRGKPPPPRKRQIADYLLDKLRQA